MDLLTQCKRKGCNPYTTKLTPTSIGLRLSSQRNGSQEGRNPGTRPRVAAKPDGRVLQQRCPPIDLDLLQRLGHIVRFESAHISRLFLATSINQALARYIVQCLDILTRTVCKGGVPATCLEIPLPMTLPNLYIAVVSCHKHQPRSPHFKSRYP